MNDDLINRSVALTSLQGALNFYAEDGLDVPAHRLRILLARSRYYAEHGEMPPECDLCGESVPVRVRDSEGTLTCAACHVVPVPAGRAGMGV